MKVLGRIDPQPPPQAIRYMVGDETWLRPEDGTPRRMICEEWGNLGPDIKPNRMGLRVRLTEIPAPLGALGFIERDGVIFWTDTDYFGRAFGDGASAGKGGRHDD